MTPVESSQDGQGPGAHDSSGEAEVNGLEQAAES